MKEKEIRTDHIRHLVQNRSLTRVNWWGLWLVVMIVVGLVTLPAKIIVRAFDGQYDDANHNH